MVRLNWCHSECNKTPLLKGCEPGTRVYTRGLFLVYSDFSSSRGDKNGRRAPVSFLPGKILEVLGFFEEFTGIFLHS